MVLRRLQSLRYAAREIRELGLRGVTFRAAWELERWTGILALRDRWAAPPRVEAERLDDWPARLRVFAPVGVADALRDRIPPDRLDRLLKTARDGARGRILCFGRWTADFGDPIDWHLNPRTGERWTAAVHWSRSLREERRVGDPKHTWEAGRFPQAWHMARAAAFHLEARVELAPALRRQIDGFLESNRPPRGIHWASSQETVFRLVSWLFGFGALIRGTDEEGPVLRRIAGALVAGAAHVERHMRYARRAVHNNHLLSEALGLLLAGELLGPGGTPDRWRATGVATLEEQAGRQFAGDGGYIQNSHNYHRLALQVLLLAAALERSAGRPTPGSIVRAIERSVDFLVAHQNPADGSLPNYGANDGALPLLLSTCDFSDFRPTLQAASLAARGERLYPAGPWDEEAAWLFGPAALDAPERRPERRTVSFPESGYHVLRSDEPGSFACFRCGSARSRFSQIDMLHLDVWWRGHDVLADGGSFQYNAADRWHEHFYRTAVHNTVTIDGEDQMVHFRRFKNLWPTVASRVCIVPGNPPRGLVGAHFGYRRLPGRPIHVRVVRLHDEGLWVVRDLVLGDGEHAIRLHWLCGPFPFRADEAARRVVLETPDGPFTVAVPATGGGSPRVTVRSGADDPPRGWLSRHYGEKVPVASLAVETVARLPAQLVSILASGEPSISTHPARVEVRRGDLDVAIDLGETGIPPGWLGEVPWPSRRVSETPRYG